jgi:hypothetical protein
VRRRVVTVFGVSVAAVALIAQAATAAQIHDPHDTGGKLDIESVDATRSGHELEVAVTTYDTWPSSLLAHSGGNRIKVLFDTDNDGTAEYTGSIVDVQGNLEMFIRGQGSQFEPLPVTRPDDNTALVHVPGDSPPNPLHKYQVAVKSTFVPASGPTKVDRAPNSGWIVVPHA